MSNDRDRGKAQSTPADESPDEPHLGAPGKPLARHSPFYLGFVGTLGAVLSFALLRLIADASGILVLIVVSAFIAIGLNPLVEILQSRGLRQGFSVALVALAFVGLITLFSIAIVPVIGDQLTAMQDNLPAWIDQLRSNQFLLDLDDRYNLFDRIEGTLTTSTFGGQVFGGVLGIGKFVLSALFNTFVIFVLTLYILASLPKLKHSCYQLVPASRRDRVTRLGDAILAQTGRYVAGAAGVAITAGVCAFVFCILVGLGDYAVALAVLVGLLDVIPMIGATIAAVLVTIIGFANSPGIGIACLIYFLAYQQIENYVIYPKIMSRSMSIPGVVTVVAALLGGSLLGLVGALLAIPVAAAVLFLVREVALPRQEQH